jgi:hypothetical protein
MFSMPATVRQALMRRVHRDRRRQDTDVLIIDDWSHARLMRSAMISCYDSDCCGHHVQRPRLRQVDDVARSRLRILSRRTIDRRLEGSVSRPLGALVARRTRAFGREGGKDVA